MDELKDYKIERLFRKNDLPTRLLSIITNDSKTT